MIWVVDDDRGIRFVLEKALTRAGHTVRVFDSATAAMQALALPETAWPAVVMSDLRMPGMDGETFLAQLQAKDPELPVIIMTAFSDLTSTVKAFEGGAFDYLSKPFDINKALDLVNKALAKRATTSASVIPASSPTGLLGQSAAMQEVFRAIGKLSNTTATVLLTGESGVGKEVVARALWSHSSRKNAPFVAINMGAIARDLLESELFGHEKGAFTGAQSRRLGRFEQAQGGTLFLDEIGEMPLELQTSLLRVLSQGSFYRVGGVEPIQANVRVIAATNRDLEAQVASGQFREDLYHRLNVIRLRLPALRERREDIPLLANHFMRTCAQEMGVPAKVLSDEALAVLTRFSFPGNVRQLENICRWLLVMAPSSTILASDLPQEVLMPSVQEQTTPIEAASKAGLILPGVDRATGGYPTWQAHLQAAVHEALLNQTPELWSTIMREVESILMQEALNVSAGVRSTAAQKLGVGRNMFARKGH